MDAVDKHRKSSERKTKRARGTNFATGLSGKNGTGENPRPISCTLCSKVHHLDECAEFLKKTSSRAERLYQGERFMPRLLQAWTHCQAFPRVEDPVRYAIRNTRRHFMITTGNQKRRRRKERNPNRRNQKPTKGKGKTKSTCAPPFATWRRLVTLQSLWV